MTTVQEVAKFFRCTPEQARAQFAKNAVQLQAMADRAKKSGKKVRGFTADVLQASANQYARLGAGE